MAVKALANVFMRYGHLDVVVFPEIPRILMGLLAPLARMTSFVADPMSLHT